MANIAINENGWTTIQEADKAKHIVQVSCLAEDGVVKEIRKCHNDGEEEKITGAIDAKYSLPMTIADLAKAFNEIQW